MDLVLGRFADAHLASLTEAELDELERWLEVPDQQIFAWVNGMEMTPENSTPRSFAGYAISTVRRRREYERQVTCSVAEAR